MKSLLQRNRSTSFLDIKNEGWGPGVDTHPPPQALIVSGKRKCSHSGFETAWSGLQNKTVLKKNRINSFFLWWKKIIVDWPVLQGGSLLAVLLSGHGERDPGSCCMSPLTASWWVSVRRSGRGSIGWATRTNALWWARCSSADSVSNKQLLKDKDVFVVNVWRRRLAATEEWRTIFSSLRWNKSLKPCKSMCVQLN